MGVFLRQLYEWAERPCVLTVRVASSASEIRVAGILRPYFSVTSLHGWALVPPQQHGGFTSLKLTELPIAEAEQREVLLDGRGRTLRFTGAEMVFELERDDAILTAPPRVIRNKRYLYVGGRRRRTAEPWMLR
ncbi:MAG TPA: hypothetical protein VGD01_02330 [Candidatus Elarobacter sp.]